MGGEGGMQVWGLRGRMQVCGVRGGGGLLIVCACVCVGAGVQVWGVRGVGVQVCVVVIQVWGGGYAGVGGTCGLCVCGGGCAAVRYGLVW